MTAPAFRSPQAAALHSRITDRSARAGVVGLGYAGLPLAVALSQAGFTVTGIDTDPGKCRTINAGESDVIDVPGPAVAELVSAARLHAVAGAELAGDLDTVTICVPTPLRKTRDPDLSHVISATRAIATRLRAGMLVVLESTTYPGTTEEVVRTILEQTGLRAGEDFFLAFSPERVDPGNTTWTTANVPKVVGGLTPDCAALAVALYRSCVEQVVPVGSPRTAEMVKLLENTFRAVNIGLVNEMALICDRIGVDVWEVIDAAATKPFGFMPFYPGPGLGGHCVPVDPYYLSWKVREAGFEARFIELAGQINAAMPAHVVEMIADALGDHGKTLRGSDILLLGVAYKPGVTDVRESPALDVLALLRRKGARVAYHDPLVPRIEPGQWTGGVALDSVPYSGTAIAAADCVVILTDHPGIDYPAVAGAARVVIDTRGVLRTRAPHVIRLGDRGCSRGQVDS